MVQKIKMWKRKQACHVTGEHMLTSHIKVLETHMGVE